VLLLPGREDQEIWRYFATNAMPTRQRAASVLEALAASDVPLTVPALESRGLTIYDLETDVNAFTSALPRVRIIPLAEFDPAKFI